MKIRENGVLRDATPEEEEESRKSKEEWESSKKTPTDAERIAELESKLDSFESAYQRGVDEA